jgi:protein SCO1/2
VVPGRPGREVRDRGRRRVRRARAEAGVGGAAPGGARGGPRGGAGRDLRAAGEPVLPFGGPFALVDHDGRPRRDTDFRGRHLLVYFGYTSCPDLCPLGLDTIAQALDLLGPRADAVQPVFVTVDPARDTPEVLREYVASFDARLLGLTGSEADIRSVTKAYRVHRRLVRTAPDGGGGRR